MPPVGASTGHANHGCRRGSGGSLAMATRTRSLKRSQNSGDGSGMSIARALASRRDRSATCRAHAGQSST